MRRHFRSAAFLLGTTAALTAFSLSGLEAAHAQTPSPAPAVLTVTGAVTTPENWTAAQLSEKFAADIHTIDYTLKGTKHTARAVPLLSLLTAAGPRTNPHIKHHDLQFVVAAEGEDGYTVDFSYPELLPSIGNRAVWVALEVDGKPLTGEEGPVELIVPDDVKPARWVHSLVHIVVVDGAAQAGGEGELYRRGASSPR